MEEKYKVIKDTDFDFGLADLKEIANVGSGNAATALAGLLNTRVNMGIPDASFVPFQNLSDKVGGADRLMVGVLVKIKGDMTGMMMFLMGIEQTDKLIASLFGAQRLGTGHEFNEMEFSAIQEIGNILCGSYVSALAAMFGKLIDQSIPYVTVDMAGAILSVPAIEFGKVGDSALFIETRMSTEDDLSESGAGGIFILVPDLLSDDEE